MAKNKESNLKARQPPKTASAPSRRAIDYYYSTPGRDFKNTIEGWNKSELSNTENVLCSEKKRYANTGANQIWIAVLSNVLLRQMRWNGFCKHTSSVPVLICCRARLSTETALFLCCFATPKQCLRSQVRK